jgi:hypothetical protein
MCKQTVKILRRTHFIDTGRPRGAHNPDNAPNYAAQAININLTKSWRTNSGYKTVTVGISVLQVSLYSDEDQGVWLPVGQQIRNLNLQVVLTAIGGTLVKANTITVSTFKTGDGISTLQEFYICLNKTAAILKLFLPGRYWGSNSIIITVCFLLNITYTSCCRATLLFRSSNHYGWAAVTILLPDVCAYAPVMQTTLSAAKK